jgi:hypothetical protein
MNNKSITEHLINAMITAVITAAIVALTIIWLATETEDTTEDYIVTVDYDCRVVLLKPKDSPENVVNECRDRFRFISEQPKSSI